MTTIVFVGGSTPLLNRQVSLGVAQSHSQFSFNETVKYAITIRRTFALQTDICRARHCQTTAYNLAYAGVFETLANTLAYTCIRL